MKSTFLVAVAFISLLTIGRADTILFNQTSTLNYSDADQGPMNIGDLYMSGTSAFDVNSTASASITDGPGTLQLANAQGGDETIEVANSGSGNFDFNIARFGRQQGTTINFEENNTGSGTTQLTTSSLNGGDGNDLTFWAFYGGNDFAATNNNGQVVAGTAYYNDGGNDTGATNLATWASASGNFQDYTSDSALTTYTGVLTGNAEKHGLRISNAAGASLDLGGYTLTEAGLIDAEGAGAVTISDGTLTAQNLTNELIVNQNNTANTMTISASITGGNSSFVKSGAGTLVLTGTNNYGGNATWVNAGKLVINGSTTNNSSQGFIVQQGATLAGTGSIFSNSGYTVYGALEAGDPTAAANPLGTLTLNNGNLNFQAGSAMLFNINGAASNTVAFGSLGNWLSLGSGNATLEINATDLETNTPYVVFSNVSTSGYTFADITGAPAGYTSTLTYTGADGGAFGADYANDYVLTFETPEPSTWAMMGLGALGLMFLARRKLA